MQMEADAGEWTQGPTLLSGAASVTKSPSLLKNSKQDSSTCDSSKAPRATEVRGCPAPACVELGLVSPEGPAVPCHQHPTCSAAPPCCSAEPALGGPGHNPDEQESFDNQGLNPSVHSEN